MQINHVNYRGIVPTGVLGARAQINVDLFASYRIIFTFCVAHLYVTVIMWFMLLLCR